MCCFFFGSSTGVAKTNRFELKLLFLAYFGNSTFQDKAGLGIPKPCFRGSKSVQAFYDTCSIFVYGSCPFKKQRERGRNLYIYIYICLFIQMDSLLFMHYILHMNLLIACQTHTHTYIYMYSSFIFIYICNHMCSPKPPHWRKGLTSTITPTNWT